MRFLHISDLHLGKRVNEFSMLEEQKHVLRQILDYVREKQVSCVLIAGDLYDKPVPSAAAVATADGFLTALSRLETKVCLISGNHDSQERLAFLGQVLERDGIYLGARTEPVLKRAELSDEYGPVHVYLMPYVRPEVIKSYYPQETIESCQDAVSVLLAHTKRQPGVRSILVAHQFVTGQGEHPDTCDSETISVGGTEAMDVSCLEGFSYVALGHLHGPQRVGKDTVRYAGSPLKYSFSEERHHKSAVLFDLSEKGQVSVELLPLQPLHDMRTIRGPLEGLLSEEAVALGNREDYIRAEVTDEKEMTNVLERLRAVYPNLMELSLENRKYREIRSRWKGKEPVRRSPLELFAEFYEMQNGHAMDQEEEMLLETIQKKLSGEGEKL